MSQFEILILNKLISNSNNHQISWLFYFALLSKSDAEETIDKGILEDFSSFEIVKKLNSTLIKSVVLHHLNSVSMKSPQHYLTKMLHFTIILESLRSLRKKKNWLPNLTRNRIIWTNVFSHRVLMELSSAKIQKTKRREWDQGS